MKKSACYIILSSIFIMTFSGCKVSQAVAENNTISLVPKPTVSNINENKNSTTAIDKENYEEGNRIKNCSPQEIYQDEILTVTFQKPHGGYLAIYRENQKQWYFLYGANEGNFPVLNINEFENYSSLELDTSKVRQTNFNKTDSNGNYIIERVFYENGWYRIMVSNEDFGQDDPPYHGMCRVYFVNKKRPQ